MFYEPGKTDHGLPYDPFKACVIPRPIGWISTLSPSGKANLAPYSQFNNLTFDPPYVMFSANQTPLGSQKDTVRNVEATGVFVWNLATYALRDAVNMSAKQVAPEVDEFELAGLEKEDAKLVAVEVERECGEPGKGNGKKEKVRLALPMVAQSPIHFECTYYTTLRLPGTWPIGPAEIVIGKVVGIHVDDSVLTDGKIDVRKTLPIARCGYLEYAVVGETFEMRIPGETEGLLGGMMGDLRGHREGWIGGGEGLVEGDEDGDGERVGDRGFGGMEEDRDTLAGAEIP